MLLIIVRGKSGPLRETDSFGVISWRLKAHVEKKSKELELGRSSLCPGGRLKLVIKKGPELQGLYCCLKKG